MQQTELMFSETTEADERVSEARLVHRARAGDRNAWDKLLRQNTPTVQACLRAMNVPPNDMDDLMQETLLSTYKALKHFRGECRLSTWMGQIARNAARSHYARCKRRGRAVVTSTSECDDTFHMDGSTPEGVLSVSQMVHELAASLSAKDKELLRLRLLDGESYKSLADKLECPIGTIRSRLFRTRKVMLETIAQ
ncbi:MAG: sigma-70 family RNA polymerase sigma factor [Wenzhouxiangellaceae bacterium]|nr:sigma-70 family RNA polymerase sigma factor [Wenzhouxiangellaceae bacterium]